MKMRYITLSVTVLVGLVMVFMICKLRNETTGTVDVVNINERCKQIESGLANNTDAAELENTFNCRIYFKTDADYESSVMKEIKNSAVLYDYEKGNILTAKIAFDGESKAYDSLRKELLTNSILFCMGLLLFCYVFLFFVYFHYIHPFRDMQGFASEVAKGNLDAPLKMTKHNYFGAFTESFDILREELKKAKENEYKANISKKELVAELSHDMKTPIAIIKATCEVLSFKDKNPDTQEKVRVIEQKADMIDQLIGNMFHATLEELESLKVEPVELLSDTIAPLFQELKYYGNITCNHAIPGCLIYADILRLKQVIDNIVNNSYKYAGTPMDVTFYDLEEGIRIELRDYGSGVPEEELPLVTEKFYRGSNGKGKAGTGLGLYLSKYFMESMKGGFECYNENGFVVNLFLRKV